MKNFKQKTKEARHQILYDYREKLMKYPNMYKPQSATKATAEYFRVSIMTVYRAVRDVRKAIVKKGATE